MDQASFLPSASITKNTRFFPDFTDTDSRTTQRVPWKPANLFAHPPRNDSTCVTALLSTRTNTRWFSSVWATSHVSLRTPTAAKVSAHGRGCTSTPVRFSSSIHGDTPRESCTRKHVTAGAGMHRPRTSDNDCFADAAGLQTQVSVATACCTGRGLLNALIRATMDSVVNTSSRGCIGHTMALSLIRLKGMVYGVYFVTGYAIRMYLMYPWPWIFICETQTPRKIYNKTLWKNKVKRSRTFIFYSLTF